MKRLLILFCLMVLSPTLASAQVYYVSPKIGTGTEADPIRAHRASGAWADCMDLKTHFLCSGPSVPAVAGVFGISVDKLSRLTAQQKTALQSVLGKTVTAETFEDLMTDIIDTKAIALRPHKDNFQHVKIHGVGLWSRPAPLGAFVPGVIQQLDAAFHLPMRVVEYAVSTTIAWAASITESFTASNGDLDGCQARGCSLTWVEFNGTNWTIVSNQASSSSGGTSEARADSALATDDHEITVTVVTHTLGTNLSVCGPITRKDNSATRTFYRWTSALDTGVDEHRLGYRVAGVTTTISTDTTDFAASETLRLVTNGDQISGYRNGVLLLGPTTDATISGNTYVGIQLGITTTSGSCVIDGLSAEDITTSTGRNRGIPWFK